MSSNDYRLRIGTSRDLEIILGPPDNVRREESAIGQSENAYVDRIERELDDFFTDASTTNESDEENTIDVNNFDACTGRPEIEKDFFWSELPSSDHIVNIRREHQIYPNFPHLYNWERCTLKDEHIDDFISVVFASTRNGHYVNKYIVFRCLYELYRAEKFESRTLARAFGCFLLVHVRDIKSREDIEPLIDLPSDLVNPKYKWIDIYRCIEIDDFIEYIVPAMLEVRTIPNRSERCFRSDTYNSFPAKLDDSFVCFSLATQWLIREINNINSATLANIVDVFKNFAVSGNYFMALPFSFFTPFPTIQRYCCVPKELKLSRMNRTALYFILGFRNVGNFQRSMDRCTFRTSFPNYRYLDMKLSILSDSLDWLNTADSTDSSHSNTIIKIVKIFGIVPSDIMHRVKLDDTSRREIQNLTYWYRESSNGLHTWHKDARELFSLDQRLIDRYENSSVLSNEKTALKVSESRRSTVNDDSSDDTFNCVVCLCKEPTEIFITCLHKICCSTCCERLLRMNGKCPVCRATVVARFTPEDKKLYDKVILCVLRETYSMFRNIILP